MCSSQDAHCLSRTGALQSFGPYEAYSAYYITIHRADGYDEIQWCILHTVCKVFDDDADVFWAFTMICGYQRPYRSIHGEKGFNEVVKQVVKHVRVELCFFDADSYVCRNHITNNVVVGGSTMVFHMVCYYWSGSTFLHRNHRMPIQNAYKVAVIAAQLLHQAAGDTPRIYAQRNKIFSAFFSTRITDDKIDSRQETSLTAIKYAQTCAQPRPRHGRHHILARIQMCTNIVYTFFNRPRSILSSAKSPPWRR